MTPKLIALYLPQYHTFPENDEWWGKGFTEWTNVKKAKPLYKNHNQPRVPLNDNYYNLMDSGTFDWQISLAKNYGIDAFCFYHYWFNGKLLLNAPLENYLKRKELDLPYCFSWANEPWTRSWDGENRCVLMNQVYGGKTDIINHFKYMLPFFLDSRYIKKDNKPVFVLYRANSISYLSEMIDVWNKLALENGFDGVFFVESLTGFQDEKFSSKTDACFYFEPMWILKKTIFQKILRSIKSPKWRNHKESYEKVWKKILKKEELSSKRWAGGFVDWDNSPRKGKNGVIFEKTSVELFYKFLTLQFEKMKKAECPVCFINAWNEWGEGTYLEPDTKNKYGFLEAIKKAKENR